jgi:proline iminopeptidase
VNFAVSSRDRLLAYRRTTSSPLRLTPRRVRLGSRELAVFTSPPRPSSIPLVCINGGLLFGHQLLWPALSPLARERQLILFDQRGRGESDAPASPLAARIEHDADDVAALRGALGYARWDVLGHSWGAGIALLAADRDANAVRRLILVDSVGLDGTWMPDIHQSALDRLGPSDRAVLQRLDPAQLREPDAAAHSAYARALSPAWFADAAMGRAFTPPRSDSLTGCAVAARLHRDGYDWRGTLRAVNARTLVLHGERDLMPPRVAHEVTAFVPNARLELIPGCGHMPYWEAPETFFQIVDSFLGEP